MAAKLTMLARSALPSNTKVATASAEILRRIKRSSTALSQGDVEKILVDYMDDLCGMGYGLEWRKRVLTSAMVGYKRILYKESVGNGRRNRLGACTLLKRRVQKLCGPRTWFNMRQSKDLEEDAVRTTTKGRIPRVLVGGEKPTESVMFIPYTEGGNLKKMLSEGEEKLVGYGQVRFVEMTGRTMESTLVNKDPWSGSCARSNCFPCTTGKVGHCM